MLVECPTDKAPSLEPPTSTDDGYIKQKHLELAFDYNKLAGSNDAKADCIESFNNNSSLDLDPK